MTAEVPEERLLLCKCGQGREFVCEECGVPWHQSIGRPSGPHGHHRFEPVQPEPSVPATPIAPPYWPDYDWSSGKMVLGIEGHGGYLLHFNIPADAEFHDEWMALAHKICEALNG